MPRPSWTSVVLASLVAAGCSSNPPAPASDKTSAATASAGAPAPAAEAQQIFSMRCMPCHGPDGRGDGPASASLTPKPRNFHDVDWQKGVTDEHIAQIIQYGGAAVGKSPAMPPNPDLTEKPALVAALKNHIRGLGR